MINRLSRWKTRLGYGWHLYKLRHTYWVVEQRGTKVGYVSFGDLKAIKHFTRYYLASADGVVILRKWRWSALKESHMWQMAQRYGLAVTTDRCLPAIEGEKLLSWPVALQLVVDLPNTLEEYRVNLSRSAKSDIRRIRKYGLTMKVSRDPGRLEKFYRNFYRPSALARYGNDAYIYDLRKVLQILEDSATSELIEVWCAGEWIAGCLCEQDHEGYHMRRLGWLNGNEEHYAKGALGALYWFAADRAFASGCRRLLYGEVDPYLEHGLFYFKTKWGGRLSHRHSNFGSWLVAVDPTHRDCQAFFNQHSLVMKSEAMERFNVLSGRPQNEVPQALDHVEQISKWRCLDDLPHG